MQAPESIPIRLQIGEWCLDPLAHELERDGERQRLPKRQVRLLLALCQQAGRTLTREELLDTAWDRRVVGDEVLSRSIAELRQALGDDARAPRYIETIPKTGYRLIATVSNPAPMDYVIAAPTAPAEPLGSPAEHAAAHQASHATPEPWHSHTTSRLFLGLAVALLAMLATTHDHWMGDQPEPIGWTEAAMAREHAFISELDWTRQPRFSKDGLWLAYVSQSPPDGHARVRLRPAAGGEAREVDAGSGRLSGPVLSPDSKRLAVLARENDACQVREVALPSGPWRIVAECAVGSGDSMEWTPDGHLIFTAPATANTGAGLVQINPDSGQRRLLTSPPTAAVADVAPRLDARGRLAFLRGEPHAQQLWLLEQGHERLLLAQPNRIPGLAWTANGQQLLVASNATGYPALHAVNPESGASRLLGGRGAATLDIASDGSLVYEQRNYDANLWLHAEDGSSRVLTTSTRYDAMPALSPDGSHVAFASNRDGPGSIWLLNLASGEETRLPLPTATWTRPSWSQDGASLLLTRYQPDGTYALARYHLADQSLLTLDIPFDDAHAGMEARDGSLFLVRTGAAANTLWRWRPGEVAQHLDHAGLISEFRSDGNWFAYQRPGEAGIVVHSPGKSEGQAVLAELGIGQPRSWSLQQGNLIYAAKDDRGASLLWRLDLERGTLQPWLAAEPGTAGPNIAASADFKSAIVSRIDRLQTDLLRVPAPD